VYVKIQNSENIEGNIKIYDMNGSVAACPEGDGWFFVDGDEANVWFYSTSGVGIRMDFYAGDFQLYDNLSIGTEQPKNLTMLQQVFTGDNAIRVFVDPENNVYENSKDNNYADQALIIHPSRDFTVNNAQLFHNDSEIGINDMIMDGDTVRVNTTIGMGINESDPYHEYRNGNVDVAITDEHEWVNVPPRFELTPYGYAQVITYPGANALRVHFDDLSLPWGGCVEIRDNNWVVQWSRCWDSKDEFAHNSPWVNGDTVYIYKVEKPTANTPVWGRITFSIDKYQYRMLNHTTMLLNASETRNITTKWNVSAGNHSIQVITDIEDTVGEINESNNEIRRPLYVSACKDPTILDIIFDPQKPAVGSDVLINTLIANQGNRTVSFTVDLWAEKTEYHPFESPHDDDFPAWVCPGGCEWSANPEWEIPSTYPDADWMGIHFKKIEMRKKIGETTINRNLYVHDENDTMMDNFCGSDENDIWVWVQGNKIKLSTTKCPIFPGYHVWGFNITDHRYRIILNHIALTLAPNETANVTGILRDVRAGNHSMNYTIHANLDMDNVVYEINESNNEIVKILNLAIPDFKVDINPPTKYSGISAVFKNIGFGSTDTRVFFSREVDYSIRKSGSRYIRVPAKDYQIPDDIELDDIDWIRVHFKKSNVKDGGYLEVGNERYEKSESDFWSPWVRGDRVSIKYTRTSFEIDRYEFAEEDFIDDFDAGGRVCLDIPWEGYTEPYNLTVWIDPFDEILEGNEDNNKDTALVYMDIMADRIKFVSPDEDMLSLDAEKFVIDGYITNGGFKDGIAFPVSDFNVTLEFRRWYPNGTIGESVFNITEHIGGPFYTGQKTIRFEFDPSEKLEAGGNYTVRLIADSAADVSESNEENNIVSEEIFVYNFSGYTGGGELINVAQGEVRGRVVYTVGDKDSCEYSGMTPTGGEKTVKYTGVVPDDASNIEFARIFVHWFTWKLEDNRLVPVLADMDATFNGHSLIMSGNYSDNPGATMNDAGYGLYSFDVAKYVTKGENEATVRITSDWSVGIHAIGLLVVYEDEDEPLTKYWINEGADIVMAANDAIPSGLSDGDCITTALFDGVEREDTDNVNATLLTVLGFYAKYGEPSDDALKFNDQLIGSIIHTSNICGNWEYHYRDTGIALTKNRWDDVTDHLKCGDNLADIQSLGNYMMPNNAFLRLIFPPDLAVTDIDAPISAVVGKRYVINTTISNEGRSNATDFNVTFYSNGKKLGRQKVSRLNSGDNITLQFNWKPMYMGKIYTLKAVADELSGPDWVELDFDNNVMTKNVPIVEAGFGNESGPVGAGGEGIGGKGKGSGTSLLDAITGYLMKGTVLGGEESGGGGGRGEYSLLGWVMRFAVLTAGILVVCTGYMIERQRYQGRK
jgi:subtilase family serine protease